VGREAAVREAAVEAGVLVAVLAAVAGVREAAVVAVPVAIAVDRVATVPAGIVAATAEIAAESVEGSTGDGRKGRPRSSWKS
jgi:hypothetical protein